MPLYHSLNHWNISFVPIHHCSNSLKSLPNLNMALSPICSLLNIQDNFSKMKSRFHLFFAENTHMSPLALKIKCEFHNMIYKLLHNIVSLILSSLTSHQLFLPPWYSSSAILLSFCIKVSPFPDMHLSLS